MSDGWEDWEDYEIVPLNEEQLKILEERKLVEESDNALAKDLFKNIDDDLVYKDLEKMKSTNIIIENTYKTVRMEKSKISNQKINEDKLKELSEKIKKTKASKEREKELFGEAEYYDEYEEYQDKFY